MAVSRPDINYSGVPTVEAGGGGGTPMSVHANANDFGGQVGEAEQQVGQEGFQAAQHYAQMATEAKANDVIANQWAPAVAKLSGQYQQTQGMDAVKGLEPFQQNLTALHNQFLANASSPYEKQILGSYMSKHVAQEVDTAQRHQDTQLTAYEDKSNEAFVSTLSSNAISNYNNPDVVKSNFDQMDAQIQKHGIDRGLPPEAIQENQRNARGATIASMVSRAVTSGDAATANSIYSENKDLIPGHQQLEIDKTLHSENMRQNGESFATSLLQGKPVPSTGVGHSVPEVQATVASAAQQTGVDPNHALTVASIESGFGQNVGKRGDIGQTGKGGDLPTQAANLTTELKKSDTIADNVLGRKSEPWEGYVCYQQGAGGGPALLKAAQDNPTARAVDVLKPLYKSAQDAQSAILNNGGNSTMTSGQFLDFIKQNYQAHAQRAQCDMPQMNAAYGKDVQGAATPSDTGLPAQTETPSTPAKLSDAILAPTKSTGVAVQPGATPVQSLMELDKVYPDAVTRANQIPNLDLREATLRSLESNHKVYEQAASAYKANLLNQVSQISNDPKFTSMDDARITPEMRSALMTDAPHSIAVLEASAERNANKSSGTVTKDMREYGGGFYNLFKAVHAQEGDPDRITDLSQLQSHVGKDGDLTIAGYDRLTKEMSGKNTPDGDAEGMMKKQFFANAKSQISGADEGLHIKDPKGDELYLKFMAHALPAYEKGKTDGKSPAQLLNPESPDYIGKAIESFKRPMSQWVGDMTQDDATTTPEALIKAVQTGKMTRADGEALALKNGWIKAKTTAVDVPRPE